MYIFYVIFPPNFTSQGKTDHWSTLSNHQVKQRRMDTI